VRARGAVVAWALLCALTGPLWVVGAVLAWTRWALDRAAAWVICWGFWVPTRTVWTRLVGAYRRATADTSPAVADELERVRKAQDFTRRARRVGRGR
jgi:hypothetical protein